MARADGPVPAQPRIGWEFFGSELKRRRERAGFTQQQLGATVYCSGSYIGQFEAALRKPQLDVAQRIDAELKTDGFFARMCEELINSSHHAAYFAEAADLEASAATIREYAPMFVPGLLQTADYARAVFLAAEPLAPDEAIDALVRARLHRAHLLDHPTRPLLWVVLDESVIRRRVGDAQVMADQLAHIATLAHRRRIVVQLLGYEAGAPALGGMITLMTFDDAPPAAYVEGPRNGNLLDDPAEVAQHGLSYDHLRAAALSPAASLLRIQSAAEEYRHEH